MNRQLLYLEFKILNTTKLYIVYKYLINWNLTYQANDTNNYPCIRSTFEYKAVGQIASKHCAYQTTHYWYPWHIGTYVFWRPSNTLVIYLRVICPDIASWRGKWTRNESKFYWYKGFVMTKSDVIREWILSFNECWY